MSATDTRSEVEQVVDLLAKARHESAEAAMWLDDVAEMCRGSANGKALAAADAARLLGLAHAARYDAESAVEAAGRAVDGLLVQLHLAEEEAS